MKKLTRKQRNIIYIIATNGYDEMFNTGKVLCNAITDALGEVYGLHEVLHGYDLRGDFYETLPEKFEEFKLFKPETLGNEFGRWWNESDLESETDARYLALA